MLQNNIMNRVTKYFRLWIIALLPLCLWASENQNFEDVLKNYSTYVEKVRKRWQAPGLAIAIFHKGKVHYINSGVTCLGTKDPITENSIFCVMSLTKVATSIILHQLADEGLVDLEAPVTQYLPWFKLSDPEDTKKVKVRHLVSHCIGLPAFSGDTLWHLGFSREEVLTRLANIPLKHKIGEKYGYQNIYVGVAGMLIESVLNKPLPQIIQERIFDPLDMRQSSMGDQSPKWWEKILIALHLRKAPLMPITSHSYVLGKVCPNPYSLEPYEFNGTSGINSSSSDYLKLIRCIGQKGVIASGPHQGERLISERAWKMMSSCQIPIHDPREEFGQFPKQHMRPGSFYYGNGMFGIDYGVPDHFTPVLFHMGACGSWRGFWLTVPGQDFTMILLCNYGPISANLLPEVIGYNLLDHYCKLDQYDWDTTRYQNFEKAKKYLDTVTQLWVPAPCSDYEALVGTYTHSLYGEICISEKNDSLYLSYPTFRRTMKLSHISGGLFSFEEEELIPQHGSIIPGFAIFAITPEGKTTLNISPLREGEKNFQKKNVE